MPPQPCKGAWQDGSLPGAIAARLDGCSGNSWQLQALGACCESQQSETSLFRIAKHSFARCYLGVCNTQGKYRIWERGKGGKNIDGEIRFLSSHSCASPMAAVTPELRFPCELSILRGTLLWFNPSQQLSTMQPLTQSPLPVGWGGASGKKSKTHGLR